MEKQPFLFFFFLLLFAIQKMWEFCCAAKRYKWSNFLKKKIRPKRSEFSWKIYLTSEILESSLGCLVFLMTWWVNKMEYSDFSNYDVYIEYDDLPFFIFAKGFLIYQLSSASFHWNRLRHLKSYYWLVSSEIYVRFCYQGNHFQIRLNLSLPSCTVLNFDLASVFPFSWNCVLQDREKVKGSA